jgi:hypothetical protein
MLQPILNEHTNQQNFNGFFYPGQNINNLGNWDSQEGYKIKLENAVELEISGWRNPNKKISLEYGWNLIPVLSDCSQPVLMLFEEFNNEIVIVKEVAGMRIYWPAMNINSLDYLEPGKSYLVLSNSAFTLTFPECE